MTALTIVGIIGLCVSTFVAFNPTRRPHLKRRVVAGLMVVASFALVMWSSAQFEAHQHKPTSTVREISV